MIPLLLKLKLDMVYRGINRTDAENRFKIIVNPQPSVPPQK